MSRAVEDLIGAAAARQHGVVTWRQLLEAGISASGINRRLQSGRVRRLHQGVYLAAPFALPHTRAMAAVLASHPRAWLSHASAGSLWEVQRAVDGPIDVIVLGNRGRRPGIRAHRVARIEPDEHTVREGIPVTTPARTLMDLGTVLEPTELETAVARAERAGLVTPEALEKLAARYPGNRGARALRAVLRIEGGPALTRSEAEAKLLALIREARLPPPECNVSVGRYEVDFLWRRAGIAVEVDGYRYHASRPRFYGDRQKDAELVAAGLTVLHLSWRQITEDRLATMVQLGQALARTGNRP